MSQRVVVVTATITCNGATLRLLSLNHFMRSKIPTTSFTVFFRFRFHMQTIFVQHGTNFFALLKSFSNPKPIMPYSAYQIPCDLRLWNWPCKAKFNNLTESVIITIYRWKCHRALICHASILYKPASIKVKHFIIIFFNWYSPKQALDLNVFHLQWNFHCLILQNCEGYAQTV